MSTAPRGRVAAAARRRRALARIVVLLTLVGMLIPLVSMAEFSFRFPLTGKVDAAAWQKLFGLKKGSSDTMTMLSTGLINSAIMAVMTVAIMILLLLPTMVWVRLKVPKVSRLLEFVCLLPLTIPAVVLVVGLAPIYRFIATQVLDSNTIWLAFAYVILVLPYSYRALDAGLRAIDIATLSEAARSLGASWATVLVRVIIPNLRSALVSACFVSIAVVLGEFTLARLLARDNLQTALFQINLSDGQIAAATSLLALGLTTLLLIVLDLLTSRRRTGGDDVETVVAPLTAPVPASAEETA